MTKYDMFMQAEENLPELFSKKQLEDIRIALREFEYSLIYAKKWSLKKTWQIKPRTVPDSFFFFPINGTFNCEVDGTRKKISPGQVMLVSDSLQHSVSLHGDERKYEAITLHAQINNAWQQPLLSMFNTHFALLPESLFWSRNLKLLVSTYNSDSELGKFMGEAVLKNIMVYLISGGLQINAQEKRIDPRISKSILYINENYMNDITVSDLAQSCQISCAQFRKLFSSAVKTTPKIYIANHRLKIAAKLLRTSTMRINEIGFQVGFNEEHYFYFKFKEQFGCTPTEYRMHGPEKSR